MKVEIWTKFWDSESRIIEENHRIEETNSELRLSLVEVREALPNCNQVQIIVRFEV